MSPIKFNYPKLGRSHPDLKRRILRRAQQALYLSGLAAGYAKLTHQNGALIVMFHSVVSNEIAPYIDPNNSVTVEQFERQLQYLQKHCNVISFTELKTFCQQQEPLPDRSVVITFDDGYLDNLTVAAPLLEKYKLPAILFLCSGYIERAEPQWIDQLYTAFQFRTKHQLCLPDNSNAFDLLQATEMLEAYRACVNFLITSCYQERTRLLQLIRDQLKPDKKCPELTLNWDDTRDLRDKFPNIELGLHTRDHLDLTTLDDVGMKAEIDQCKSDYERELGATPRYFSYPYGRNTAIVRKYVKNSGFDAAVVTQPSALTTEFTDLYTLPRLEIPGSMLDLRLWITGAFPNLATRLFRRVYE